MKRILITVLFFCACAKMMAAGYPDSAGRIPDIFGKKGFLDKRIYFSGSFGQNSSTSLGALYGFRKISDGKFNVYLGARATYKRFNVSELFLTAPAELTRETTGFAAVTAAKHPENMDTFTFNSGSNMALNLSIHASYRLAKVLGMRLTAEANADLIGFSVGPTITGTYSHNGDLKTSSAKPSSMNIFMLGDNNRGSLNSEFLLRFGPDKLSVHAGFSVSMWEHTSTYLQNEGEISNDRFRMRSTALVVGGRYRF